MTFEENVGAGCTEPLLAHRYYIPTDLDCFVEVSRELHEETSGKLLLCLF